MAKTDEEKQPKADATSVETKEVKQNSVEAVKTDETPASSLDQRVASQRKVQMVFAVLLGIMFLWLAFITARMYDNNHMSQREFTNRSQYWQTMPGGNGSGGFQFR